VVMLLDSDGNFFNGFISMEGNPNISWKWQPRAVTEWFKVSCWTGSGLW
jgi:hypothetical protein